MVAKAAIARDLGVAPPLIAKYTREGMPTSSLDEARAWYRENINRRVRPGADAGSAPDYQESRAWREAAEAELAQIKVDRERGQLIEQAAVRAEFAKQTAAVREGLLTIPARMAPVLAAESRAAMVQSLLDAELRAVLAQFVGEAT